MKRIELLDLCRSLCVIVMVLWHALYDLALFGQMDMAVMESLPARIVAFLCAGGFILISGVCARLSQNNLRRGFFIFCVGAGLSVVMALLNMPVAFGILQFFGTAMILYSVLRRYTDRWEKVWFPLACLALFVLSVLLTRSVTVSGRWLYPLGFHTEGFYSADYYPLLPWLFLFLAGTWLGGKVEKRREAPIFHRHYPPALTFAGRHSLLLYLLHQPVLCGIFALLFR
ncbi:MAG: DUF1624 domain-containing protein [Oscillospiraceae bacterium]